MKREAPRRFHTRYKLHNRKLYRVQAIESYLRDLEPPQREKKTYDAYRATP